MITEAYVSFEVAKLLKDKGFDEFCLTSYNTFLSNHKVEETNVSEWGKANQIYRPTLQMAMKWLRVKHNIYISIQPDFPSDKDYKMCWCWCACILYENCISTKGYQCYIETYEQACETAIKYCLENLI